MSSSQIHSSIMSTSQILSSIMFSSQIIGSLKWASSGKSVGPYIHRDILALLTLRGCLLVQTDK